MADNDDGRFGQALEPNGRRQTQCICSAGGCTGCAGRRGGVRRPEVTWVRCGKPSPGSSGPKVGTARSAGQVVLVRASPVVHGRTGESAGRDHQYRRQPLRGILRLSWSCWPSGHPFDEWSTFCSIATKSDRSSANKPFDGPPWHQEAPRLRSRNRATSIDDMWWPPSHHGNTRARAVTARGSQSVQASRRSSMTKRQAEHHRREQRHHRESRPRRQGVSYRG